MYDDKVGNAAGKWGAIGLIAGGVLPYLIGGLIKDYSLITALGGAFLLGFIALEGAKAQAEETAPAPPAQPQVPPPEEPQKSIEMKLKYASGIEDAGFLRRQFTFIAEGHEVEVTVVVDYNGVGPSGSESKEAVKFIYGIPALNVSNGLIMNYVSTERAIEVLKSLKAEMVITILSGKITKDIEKNTTNINHSINNSNNESNKNKETLVKSEPKNSSETIIFAARTLVDYAFKYNDPHPIEIKAAFAANIHIDKYKTEMLMLRAFVIDLVIVEKIMKHNLDTGKAVRQAYCDAWQSIESIFPLFIDRMNAYDDAMKNDAQAPNGAISLSIPSRFVSYLADENGEIPHELQLAATINLEKTANETSELIQRLVDNKLLAF